MKSIEIEILLDQGEDECFFFWLTSTVKNVFYLIYFLHDLLLLWSKHLSHSMATVNSLLVVGFKITLFWEGNQPKAEHYRYQCQAKYIHNHGKQWRQLTNCKFIDYHFIYNQYDGSSTYQSYQYCIHFQCIFKFP